MTFLAKDIDWLALERDYRAGVLSNRKLAEEYGVSESVVRKKARQLGWVKGEAAVVRTMARDIANKRSIPKVVDVPAEHLEQLATVAADILINHRKQVGVMGGLAMRMVEQLTEATEQEADLAQEIEDFFLAKAANNPLMAAQYRQQCNHALHAIALGSRSKTLLNLTSTIEKLQKLDRTAWSLDEGSDNRSYEDLLAELDAQRAA